MTRERCTREQAAWLMLVLPNTLLVAGQCFSRLG